MAITHTAECLEGQLRRETKVAAFEQRFPNYCKNCGGSEVVGSGAIDPDTGFPDIDPCPNCVCKHVCGLCLMFVVDPEEPRLCGHDYRSIYRPPAHECCCWVEEEAGLQAAEVRAAEQDIADSGMTQDDFEHAASMLAEHNIDANAADGEEIEYDFYQDDLNYDAQRERGYR